MPQQPILALTDEEQTTLETFIHRGKANARTLTRARILLKSAQREYHRANRCLCVGQRSPTCNSGLLKEDWRRFCVDTVQQHRRSALSGLQMAHLIAIACSPSPEGHDYWTVRLSWHKKPWSWGL